jgi:hypothetical protein
MYGVIEKVTTFLRFKETFCRVGYWAIWNADVALPAPIETWNETVGMYLCTLYREE